MEYQEILFHGEYLQKEQVRIYKERLTAASFNAWQNISSKTDKIGSWQKYLKSLRLSDEPKLSKEDLKREADHAMENVNRIIEKAKNVGR